MGSHLPVLRPQDVVRALAKVGYAQLKGRGKGSHIAAHHAGLDRLLIVPCHDPVKRGTLRAIIRQAGMSVDEFRALL